MTELEILAELKIAYIQLEDIIENQYEQITEQEKEHLGISMNNLWIIYKNLYERIEKEDQTILYYEKNVLIANIISADYVTRSEDYNDQYITYDETNKKKRWWEDYKFLLK